MLVLRTLREHLNLTIHCELLIFEVCCLHFFFNTAVNEIEDSGAESLAMALSSNSRLRFLYLSRAFVFTPLLTAENKIGDSMADFFASNKVECKM